MTATSDFLQEGASSTSPFSISNCCYDFKFLARDNLYHVRGNNGAAFGDIRGRYGRGAKNRTKSQGAGGGHRAACEASSLSQHSRSPRCSRRRVYVCFIGDESHRSMSSSLQIRKTHYTLIPCLALQLYDKCCEYPLWRSRLRPDSLEISDNYIEVSGATLLRACYEEMKIKLQTLSTVAFRRSRSRSPWTFLC